MILHGSSTSTRQLVSKTPQIPRQASNKAAAAGHEAASSYPPRSAAREPSTAAGQPHLGPGTRNMGGLKAASFRLLFDIYCSSPRTADQSQITPRSPQMRRLCHQLTSSCEYEVAPSWTPWRLVDSLTMMKALCSKFSALVAHSLGTWIFRVDPRKDDFKTSSTQASKHPRHI